MNNEDSNTLLLLELLDLLSDEELIRIRHRGKKKDYAELVNFLAYEQAQRKEKPLP